MTKTSSKQFLSPVWEDRPANNKELVWRYTANPILGRRAIPCAQAIFNSAIIPFDNRFVGIFRADHMNGMPGLHLGWSDDSVSWEISNDPIEFFSQDSVPPQGDYAYDPRVCRIDDHYYISWCNDYHGPTIGLARTDDFKRFEQLENAFLPFNRNGVLFPKKINGNFAMLSRPSDNGHTPFGDIFYSESPDLCYWGKHRHVMPSGNLWWESIKIGAGPTPIETEAGWLLLYHGVRSSCNGLVYSMGAALLDLDEPWKVSARLPYPILMPESNYEAVGFVPNVIFPCAALRHGEDKNRLTIYYGSADTHIAVAFTYISELIDELLKNKI
ncbi:MAG: glycoside hydrolase family 130 protein [Chthoniobacterales bacterium]